MIANAPACGPELMNCCACSVKQYNIADSRMLHFLMRVMDNMLALFPVAFNGPFYFKTMPVMHRCAHDKIQAEQLSGFMNDECWQINPSGRFIADDKPVTLKLFRMACGPVLTLSAIRGLKICNRMQERTVRNNLMHPHRIAYQHSAWGH